MKRLKGEKSLTKEKQDKDPMLYIHQPKFHKPIPQMQETFRWKKETVPVEKSDKKKKEKKRVRPIDEWESYEFASKNNLESKESITEETQSIKKGMKPLKAFKDMTVNEKLYYLNRHPLKSAPMSCEFITSHLRVKGKLIELNDQSIKVGTLNGEEVNLPISEINEVSIIAFI